MVARMEALGVKTTKHEFSGPSCRDARKLLRLSQEEFANSAGISVSTLRRFEAGNTISDYASGAIARAFDEHGVSFLTVRS